MAQNKYRQEISKTHFTHRTDSMERLRELEAQFLESMRAESDLEISKMWSMRLIGIRQVIVDRIFTERQTIQF